MKGNKKTFALILILTLFSILIYSIQLILFHKPEESMFLMFQDLAFVPIEVAIVTLIIERFLNKLEERKKNKKINVIISTFFSEIGINILAEMTKFNLNNDETCRLINELEISKKNEKAVRKSICNLKVKIHADPEKLKELNELLVEKKDFMLLMLENTNLLEHESFTDMLWAIFHVADEFQLRGHDGLDYEDIAHLSNDIKRAYTALVREWSQYIIYLEVEYPFLHQAAVKKSPFSI